ncbi:hypothetical protein HMI55_002407 [Coelomomyces lativittatus]|nr:hypothetical protein HMI55_002407 [Coelomomyces lativittatus]
MDDPTEASTVTKFIPFLHKPYLGGLKNTLTGKEYVHAFAQTITAMERRKMLSQEKFHRDAQTKYWKNRLSQSNAEKFTQMITQ